MIRAVTAVRVAWSMVAGMESMMVWPAKRAALEPEWLMPGSAIVWPGTVRS
jgi:hypothetical protein